MQQGRVDFGEIYRSFRTHWAQVDPFLLDLFNCRFPSENRLAFNFAHLQPNSIMLISNSVFRNERKRLNNLQLQSQLDLLLQLQGRNSLWLRFANDDVKAHYQHGSGIGVWQPYFSFSSTRKFSNSSFKLGAAAHFPRGLVDLRFRYNIGEHQADHFYYAKAQYCHKNIRLSAIGTVLMKGSQANLQKNDLMAAVQFLKDNWVGVVLDNEEFRKYRINYARLGSYFDSLKAVYLFNHHNLRLGLLYEYSIEDSASKKIEAAVEYRPNQALESVKLRLNTQWKMGVSLEGVSGNWRLQGGASWFNVNQSLWPSYYVLGLSYY